MVAGLDESAIEQPHHPFANDDVGVPGQPGGNGAQRFFPHRPGIQVQALPAAGGGVKSGVDIIRPGLGRGDGMAQ